MPRKTVGPDAADGPACNVEPFTAEAAAERLIQKHGAKAAAEALRQAHECFAGNLYGIGEVWHAAMRLIEARDRAAGGAIH